MDKVIVYIMALVCMTFCLSSCGLNKNAENKRNPKTTQITTTYVSEKPSDAISNTLGTHASNKKQTALISTGTKGISFILSPIDSSEFYVVELQLKKGSETFKFNNGTLSATSCVIQSYHSGIEAYLTSDALPCRYLQFSNASGVKLDELTEFSKTLYYKQSGIDKYYCIKTFDCNKYMVKIAFSSSEEDLNSKLEFLDQKIQIYKKSKADSPAEYSKTANDIIADVLNTKYGLFIKQSKCIDFFSNNLIGITENNHSYTLQMDPNDDLSALYGSEQTEYKKKNFSAFKFIDSYYVDVTDDDKLILRIQCENANSLHEALWCCIQDIF